MQTVQNLVPTNLNQFNRIAAKSSNQQQVAVAAHEQKEQVADKFNEVFAKVLACCSGWRAAITSSGQMAATKQVWLDAFTRHADVLNPNSIKAGLLRLEAQRRKWLPNPLEFIDLCTALDIPTEQQCYNEISAKAHAAMYQGKQQYSHDLIDYLAARCGGLFLCPTNPAQLQDAFNAEYLAAVELMRNGNLPDAAHAVTHQKPDANLVYYFTLVREYPRMPQLAADYLADCAAKGIVIDPVKKTVTYSNPKAGEVQA